MARQQQGDRQPGGQSQGEQGAGAAQQGGAAGGATGSSAGGTSGAGTSGAGTSGAQTGAGRTGGGGERGGAESRSERERPVPTSREGSTESRGAGSAVQRGTTGGGAVTRQQPGGLSSLVMSDPLVIADQMLTSPFSFMRRFSEDMDRLFADFGFGPASYGSPGFGSTGYGLTGRELGQRGGRSQALQQQGRQGTSVAGTGQQATWVPQIELFQRGNEIVVRADLPGLNKDDVNVEVNDDVLMISGERREEREDREEGVYHSERRYGYFQRAIPLPEGVNEEQVRAQFRDGVLEVVVPAPQEAQQRGRKVEIG